MAGRTPAAHARCTCSIVPLPLLQRLAHDPGLDEATRACLRDTFVETSRMWLVRDAARLATRALRTSEGITTWAAAPEEQVYDCRHGQSLPGTFVPDPAGSADMAVTTVYDVTARVAEFYRDVLERNSIDDHGMTLVSSVHYRVRYDNAFWNGQQMVYGDGDGTIFAEFYRSPDVIAHELTHGVTQYESGLAYDGESGALNESLSDAFGAVFHQWLRDWPVSEADGWLIGAGIMGPRSTGAGKTCLRDMADPGASHCLSPQPGSYDDFDPTADVHDNSGIPNHAFAEFARACGGRAWEGAAQVWYRAATDPRLRADATFAEFAKLTIDAAGQRGGAGLADRARAAWDVVRVPVSVAVA